MIERAFGDAAEQIATLRRFGQAQVADAVEALLASLRTELVEYLTWHDEAGAALMSKRAPGYFRARFAGWEERGLAKHQGRGRRYYRECVIPKARTEADVRADAERAAEGDAA